MSVKNLFLFVILLWSFICIKAGASRPCAPRLVEGESTVCICNSTYCDDLIRITPDPGNFVAYTSTKAGLRLQAVKDKLKPHNEKGTYSIEIILSPEKKYQTITGFGAAATDAASINWKNVSEGVQKNLINSYFSDSGSEYSFIRVGIAGTDFSEYPYAYNEFPVNDTNLSNFSLTLQDHNYKIPMIKAAMSVAKNKIKVIATTWSPPCWMKSNDAWYGISRLKNEYLQTYALYHLLFVRKYAAEGVPVWGITTSNEPMNGVIPLAHFNSLGWLPKALGSWIADHLGPTIRNSEFPDLKIFLGDDQRIYLPLWVGELLRERPDALRWIDGVAVHWYTDPIAPPSFLSAITEKYSNLTLLSTEACSGSIPGDQGVKLGSWQRAENYAFDIIEDLNYYVTGWIDWNMCLNEAGGPNWADNIVDSPIIVNAQKDEFYKQPMYYALAHFSKFLPPGSIRIGHQVTGGPVETVSFLTPRDTVVTVILNIEKAENIRIQVGDEEAVVKMEEHSISTVEMSVK